MLIPKSTGWWFIVQHANRHFTIFWFYIAVLLKRGIWLISFEWSYLFWEFHLLIAKSCEQCSAVWYISRCHTLKNMLFHKKMFWYYEIISCSFKKQHLQISMIVSMTSLLGHSVAQPIESSYQKLFCGFNSFGKNLYLVECATVSVFQKRGHANNCVWST